MRIVGCVYLISMYYKRYEVQLRITFFFSGSFIAGSISSVSADPRLTLVFELKRLKHY
jgi:hypothetical protein